MLPQVSIIIPAFNQAQYLPDAINSVINQTFTNWECIIVDDGSTDNTKAVCDEFCRRDKRINYLRINNGGPSKARNTGIAQAKGAYILPLDGDDKFSSNYVEECLKVITTSEDVKVVYGNGEKFGLINKPWSLPEFNFNSLLLGNQLHVTGLYRKSDWECIGGYDEYMIHGIEDWEFWINLLKDGGKVVKLGSITFYWRIKEQSRTTQITANLHNKAVMTRYIYLKHYKLYEKYFTNPISLYIENQALQQKLAQIDKTPFKYAAKLAVNKIKAGKNK